VCIFMLHISMDMELQDLEEYEDLRRFQRTKGSKFGQKILRIFPKNERGRKKGRLGNKE